MSSFKSLEEVINITDLYLRFELQNPDNLAPQNFKSNMKAIYEKCLSCHLFHPEIWLSIAKFELDFSGILEARTVYREAIDIIPKVALIRIAFAELEERQRNYDSTKEILKAAFNQVPSGLTFALYQRFIRRREGILAARKLFGDSLPLRQDKKIGHEVL